MLCVLKMGLSARSAGYVLTSSALRRMGTERNAFEVNLTLHWETVSKGELRIALFSTMKSCPWENTMWFIHMRLQSILPLSWRPLASEDCHIKVRQPTVSTPETLSESPKVKGMTGSSFLQEPQERVLPCSFPKH